MGYQEDDNILIDRVILGNSSLDSNMYNVKDIALVEGVGDQYESLKVGPGWIGLLPQLFSTQAAKQNATARDSSLGVVETPAALGR